MKKSFLLLAFAAITLTSLAQVKTDNLKQIPKYSPDPKRLYQLQVTADQLGSLMETSQAGIIPYLKKVKLPMDKLDNAQIYFLGLHQQLVTQFRQQYIADSLKSIKILSGK